jgi:hypothetical protein
MGQAHDQASSSAERPRTRTEALAQGESPRAASDAGGQINSSRIGAHVETGRQRPTWPITTSVAAATSAFNKKRRRTVVESMMSSVLVSDSREAEESKSGLVLHSRPQEEAGAVEFHETGWFQRCPSRWLDVPSRAGSASSGGAVHHYTATFTDRDRTEEESVRGHRRPASLRADSRNWSRLGFSESASSRTDASLQLSAPTHG